VFRAEPSAWQCWRITTPDGYSGGTPERPVDRVAERVRAASYGAVLVIAALGVTTVADVELGYSAELVFGVGAATWIAHLYAELLGRQVIEGQPLWRADVRDAMVDGSPILLTTVLPAIVLIVGRGDAVSAKTTLGCAIGVAFAQLAGICVFAARASPRVGHEGWIVGAVTASIGIAVGIAVVVLGH